MHALWEEIDLMRKVCDAEKIAMPGRRNHVALGLHDKHKTTE